jgi:hypothetical protein
VLAVEEELEDARDAASAIHADAALSDGHVRRKLLAAGAAEAVVGDEEHVVGAAPLIAREPAVEVVGDARRAADANAEETGVELRADRPVRTDDDDLASFGIERRSGRRHLLLDGL